MACTNPAILAGLRPWAGSQLSGLGLSTGGVPIPGRAKVLTPRRGSCGPALPSPNRTKTAIQLTLTRPAPPPGSPVVPALVARDPETPRRGAGVEAVPEMELATAVTAGLAKQKAGLQAGSPCQIASVAFLRSLSNTVATHRARRRGRATAGIKQAGCWVTGKRPSREHIAQALARDAVQVVSFTLLWWLSSAVTAVPNRFLVLGLGTTAEPCCGEAQRSQQSPDPLTTLPHSLHLSSSSHVSSPSNAGPLPDTRIRDERKVLSNPLTVAHPKSSRTARQDPSTQRP